MRPALVRLAALAFASAAAAAAADKSTLFDLEKDLARFFALQHEIMATDPNRHDTPADAARKKAARAELFRKHGIRDEKHWEKESQAGFGFAWSKKAERIYGGAEAVLDMRRAAGEGKTLRQYREDRTRRNEELDEVRERMKLVHDESAFDQALLAPIDGVSLEKYAAVANAAIFHGDDFAPVTRETGMTEKTFEALGEKWTARMRSDPTRLLMLKYGGHLMAAARGRFAAAGKDLGQAYLANGPVKGPEPIPFEKWVEITEFYASRSAEMKTPADITRVLQPYGMTFYEWNIVSNWWGRKRSHAMETGDQAFLARWTALREKYRLQFAAGAR
jgi:hypothetical protein